MRVKVFLCSDVCLLTMQINDFIKDKKVIDIKVSATTENCVGCCITALVMYEYYEVKEIKNEADIKDTIIYFSSDSTRDNSDLIIKPMLERIRLEYPQFTFYTANVDTWSGRKISNYNVCGVPSFIKYRDGKKVSQLTGIEKEQEIRKWIEEEG